MSQIDPRCILVHKKVMQIDVMCAFNMHNSVDLAFWEKNTPPVDLSYFMGTPGKRDGWTRTRPNESHLSSPLWNKYV